MPSDTVWRSTVETLARGRVKKYSLHANENPLRYSDVLALWQKEHAFRAHFISLLADAPFAAYFWETPPVTQATSERRFEFVLVDSAELAGVRPEPHAFAEHFRGSGSHDGIVTFPNLGGDAYLIAPCPLGPASAYPHLAAFARAAPDAQQHALWRTVGSVLEVRLQARPVWVSTAGTGIFWLHVRLDQRPKYYSYAPYREPA